MKKYFYLFLLPLCLGIAACGGDGDGDDFIDNQTNNGNGKNDDDTALTPERLAEEVAKYVSANISLDSDKKMWTANIGTSLQDRFPGKDIKYGMSIEMVADKEIIEIQYYEYTNLVPFYLEPTSDQEQYAQGSGNSYTVSVENLAYAGMDASPYGSTSTTRIDEIMTDGDYQRYPVILIGIAGIEERIKNGKADDRDMEMYQTLLGEYDFLKDASVFYTEDLSWYCSNVVKVFVEIDGTKYVIKQVKGDVRLCTYGDMWGYSAADLKQ